MSTIKEKKKPVNFIREILEPLSAKVATTATVIIVAEGKGVFYVSIPKEYMTANLATGVSAILTITSGVASTESAIINISPSEITTEDTFFDTFFIDSTGNVKRSGKEIGNWTPTWGCATGAFGAIVYTAPTYGRYTKTGNIIEVWGGIRTNSLDVGTASGAAFILGLPYPVGGYTVGGYIGFSASFAGDRPSSIIAGLGTSQLNPYYRTTANGDSAALQVSDLNTGAIANANYVYFHALYETT